METVHKTVLLNETIDLLLIQKGDVVVDATVNAGGHSSEVARRFKNEVTILGIDADPDALLRAKKTMSKYKATPFIGILSNFRDFKKVVLEAHAPHVDKVIFDLGLSSDQLEVSERGFSFKREEPLLMTFSKNPKKEDLTAYDVVNNFKRENLEAIIRGFGEENFAGRIARAIDEARQKKPIENSKELGEIIKAVVPSFYRVGKIHPATKTFQAIRMTVNDELGALEEGLSGAYEILSVGGRIAVITFHSLEDRAVKNFFRDRVKDGSGKLINKKPIISGLGELKVNTRARSAKLRVIEKVQ